GGALPMNRKFYHLLALLFSLMPLALLISCSQEDTKIEATLSSLWDNKFSTCGVGCHNGVEEITKNGPLFTSKSAFLSSMKDKTVANSYPAWTNELARTATCDSFPLIDTGNASNSILTATMIKSYSDSISSSGSCDTAYAYHNTKNQTITDSDIEKALVDWINAGAQDN
ncbi:MAG: hypothetical protein R3240_02590, partial [Gammaproteobacteria bacterium]|nr:hypothetical protein [Gammaproteobacteria bacterium]